MGKVDSQTNSLYSGGSKRLRAIVGYQFNRVDIFATYGIATYENNLRTRAARSFRGLTYGVGVGYHINDRLAVRAEAIIDDMDSVVGSSYAWDNQTTRVGVLFKF